MPWWLFLSPIVRVLKDEQGFHNTESRRKTRKWKTADTKAEWCGRAYVMRLAVNTKFVAESGEMKVKGMKVGRKSHADHAKLE